MKVRIFSGKVGDGLETEIQNWLDGFEELIDIVSSTQSESYSESYGHVVTLVILYEE